ncbi:MAG: ubiquinol-cytochrome c reductase iron-sulfur subunit [Pseudomonadota bacterium]
MADESINKGRRRFLTASTAVIGGAGLIITAIPFVETWLPSARAESAGAPVTVAIGKIEPGQMVRYGWRSQPVFVVNRTPEQLQWLPKQDTRLRDPDSKESDQPKYCQNATRSIKPEWMVLIGICTHLGCVPDYKGEVRPEPFDPNWKGGFYCPCHHSRYDLAARVYQGVPAPLNMVVPPYHFVDDTHIQIGVDPKGAA